MTRFRLLPIMATACVLLAVCEKPPTVSSYLRDGAGHGYAGAPDQTSAAPTDRAT